MILSSDCAAHRWPFRRRGHLEVSSVAVRASSPRLPAILLGPKKGALAGVPLRLPLEAPLPHVDCACMAAYGTGNLRRIFHRHSDGRLIVERKRAAGLLTEEVEKEKGEFYGMAVRGKLGDGRNKAMSTLWTKEGKYWKIVAIRIDDGSDAGITPKTAAAASPIPEAEPERIAGNPDAVKDITSFYQLWVGKRDPVSAARYVSERSYQCLAAPSETDKAIKPADRIQKALTNPLGRVPQAQNLADMMSSVQPVNELVRPVEQGKPDAFAIMAVPDQMADSFLCQSRQLPEKTRELKPNDAKYGTYYLSASRLNYGEEESPALLLLWAKDKDRWKVVAWAVEVP